MADVEVSHWLLRQVAEKESTTATVAWLQRHLGDEHDVAGGAGELPPELAAAGTVRVPFTTMAALPYAAVGRLFMTRSNQERSSCTAFLIGPDTAMTAAHCVMTPDGRWQHDLVFVTGLGTDALSARGVQCAVVHRDWGAIDAGMPPAIDYAILKIDGRLSQTHLGLVLDGDAVDVSIIGYRSDCCGSQMLSLPIKKAAISRKSSYFVSSNNPMGIGSSGSPWVSPASGKVITLNAQYPKLGSRKLSGPRFDQRTRAMLQHIQSSCR